jgi:hypothetical protein
MRAQSLQRAVPVWDGRPRPPPLTLPLGLSSASKVQAVYLGISRGGNRTPRKTTGAPSFRVLCGKVGNEEAIPRYE